MSDPSDDSERDRQRWLGRRHPDVAALSAAEGQTNGCRLERDPSPEGFVRTAEVRVIRTVDPISGAPIELLDDVYVRSDWFEVDQLMDSISAQGLMRSGGDVERRRS